MSGQWHVAVVGATGAVGRTMVRVLEERAFPVASLRLLASPRSAGTTLRFRGEDVPVEALSAAALAGVEVALFSPGAAVSAEWAPVAAAKGAVVIDNTSHFRMDTDVPLVVPEVNPHAIAGHRARGIIANPNCSTIQLVVALKPLADAWGLRRVVVTTFQSVSGAGQKGVETLRRQTRALLDGQDAGDLAPFAHPIAFEALPQIDRFLPDGYTREEHKIIDESRKIMGLPGLRLTATTVRVPVLIGHSESVNVELERPADVDAIRALWARSPGILVRDDPERSIYPLASHAAGTDATEVGRLRADASADNAFDFWCVADNLRKGAAANAVQIAETLVREYL